VGSGKYFLLGVDGQEQLAGDDRSIELPSKGLEVFGIDEFDGFFTLEHKQEDQIYVLFNSYQKSGPIKVSIEACHIVFESHRGGLKSYKWDSSKETMLTNKHSLFRQYGTDQINAISEFQSILLLKEPDDVKRLLSKSGSMISSSMGNANGSKWFLS